MSKYVKWYKKSEWKRNSTLFSSVKCNLRQWAFRPRISSIASPKFWEVPNIWIEASNSTCLGHRISMHKSTRHDKIFGGPWQLWHPLHTPMVWISHVILRSFFTIASTATENGSNIIARLSFVFCFWIDSSPTCIFPCICYCTSFAWKRFLSFTYVLDSGRGIWGVTC